MLRLLATLSGPSGLSWMLRPPTTPRGSSSGLALRSGLRSRSRMASTSGRGVIWQFRRLSCCVCRGRGGCARGRIGRRRRLWVRGWVLRFRFLPCGLFGRAGLIGVAVVHVVVVVAAAGFCVVGVVVVRLDVPKERKVSQCLYMNMRSRTREVVQLALLCQCPGSEPVLTDTKWRRHRYGAADTWIASQNAQAWSFNR
jgi:hypothetical protein